MLVFNCQVIFSYDNNKPDRVSYPVDWNLLHKSVIYFQQKQKAVWLTWNNETVKVLIPMNNSSVFQNLAWPPHVDLWRMYNAKWGSESAVVGYDPAPAEGPD